MIASLKGIVTEYCVPYVTIEVSGIGYEVQITTQDQAALVTLGSAEVKLFIHQLIREDGQWLFGFLARENRDLFRLLIKISGLGPKIAMNIISALPLSELASCVQREDARYLTKIPGIGARLAERLMVELKNKVLPKLEQLMPTSLNLNTSASVSFVDEAVSALTQLGYKPNLAIKLVTSIQDYQQLSCEQLIREALKAASKAKL